jgi:hypothetical protein
MNGYNTPAAIVPASIVPYRSVVEPGSASAGVEDYTLFEKDVFFVVYYPYKKEHVLQMDNGYFTVNLK